MDLKKDKVPVKVLLVDDNESVCNTLRQVLERNDFEVVTASGVSDSLGHIGAEPFDVLISDLHMPDAGDGLTVVSAMRHANPHAVTLVYSGYPEVHATTTVILKQADEILLKPLGVPDLIAVIRQKLAAHAQRTVKFTTSIASILERDAEQIIQHWLTKVKDNKALMRIPLNSQERTGHLPSLLHDIVMRLRGPHSLFGKHLHSNAAHMHGRLRRLQGYNARLIVEESRMLQDSIFQTLQNNLARVDFSLVLIDVMMIADEVNLQLCQAMETFAELAPIEVAA